MKLIVNITREDYSDFNKFHFLKTRLNRTIIIGLLTVIILQYLLNRPEFNLIATVISTIACIVIYIFMIYRSLNRTKNIPDSDGTILGQKEMEFKDDRIIYSTKNSQGTCEWASIKSLKENSTAFYLYMDTNMAMLIPKRSFISNQEQENFRKLIRQKIST